MIAYWKSVLAQMGSAAKEVIAIAVISILPLIIGRISAYIDGTLSRENYWQFLVNGQLAYLSVGWLATMLVYSFNKRLADNANFALGLTSFIALTILYALVIKDPTLLKAHEFFGPSALWIYCISMLMMIFADAVKAVEQSDALKASTQNARTFKDKLAKRMAGDNA